jgi:hypothetical protein
MFDTLNQRGQPPVAAMKRLEMFCQDYAYRLRQQAECVKSDSVRDRIRRKAEKVLDLVKSWRLY